MTQTRFGFPPPSSIAWARLGPLLDPEPGGGGGGGGGGGTAVEQLQAAIKDLKTKVDEFRENNIALRKANEELTAKFKDVDPEAYKKAMEAFNKLNDGEERKLLNEGKFEELFNRRVEPLKTEYQKQIEAMNGKLKKAEEQNSRFFGELQNYLLERHGMNAANEAKVKINPSALPDFLSRVREVFSINEKLGVTPREGKFGADAQPAKLDKEWIGNLVNTAPHLFEAGSGGGAGGGGGGGTGSRTIEFSNENFIKNLDAIASGKVNVS